MWHEIKSWVSIKADFFSGWQKITEGKSANKRMAEAQKISQMLFRTCGLDWEWMGPAEHSAFLAE